MSIKTYPIIGTKSSILWDEKTDAWTYISGQPVRDDNPQAYYKIIPTLYRGVDIRASSVANLPWALMKGETEFETSQEFENKTGLYRSFYEMLYLIEASMVLAGQAYWKREQNIAGYNKIRHLEPFSMKLQEDKAKNGEIVWKRNENSITKEYTPKEIVYLWYPDPFVEIGPPSSWPIKSALNACGVLANLDEFAKAYFGRGAIKATLFAASGASRETKEEFEKWWSKFVTGIKNAFTTRVINAEKVQPIVVGEGIKELENVTLSSEKREEIALALGIPMSILFANAANYATAERDKLNWYEDKVVPESNFIAGLLNEQVFEPMGLRFKFLPETLDIFQEDEKERSMALGYLFNAEVPLDIGMRILGFDLDDDQWKRIEDQVKKKEERGDQAFEQLQEGGNDNASTVGGNAPERPGDKPDPFQEKSLDDSHLKIGRELYMWRNKVESAIKRGETASSVDFIPVAIPGEVFDRVAELLKSADDLEAVKHIFTHAMFEPPDKPAQQTNEVSALVKEFKEMTQAIIWKGYP